MSVATLALLAGISKIPFFPSVLSNTQKPFFATFLKKFLKLVAILPFAVLLIMKEQKRACFFQTDPDFS